MVLSMNDVLAYSMTLSQLTLLQDKLSLFADLWNVWWIRWLIYTNVIITAFGMYQKYSVVDSVREAIIKCFYIYSRDVSCSRNVTYFHQFFHQFERYQGGDAAVGLVPIPHGYVRGQLKTETHTTNGKADTKLVYYLILYAKNVEDYDKIVTAAAEHQDRKKVRNYTIYDPKAKFTLNAIRHPERSWFDNIFFKGKSEFMQYLEEYVNRTGRFDPRFNPVRKAVVLLYGPPGNGKTSLIRAIQQYLSDHGDRRDIQINRPSLFTTRTIYTAASSDSINVFEDITDDGYEVFYDDAHKDAAKDATTAKADMVFNFNSEQSPKPKQSDDDKNSDGMTLTTWLNFFDGLVPLDNAFIVMTTNNPEYLHKAFRRPGRVTYSLLMDNPDAEQVVNIFASCYRRDPSDEERAMLMKIAKKKYCAARLKYSMSSPLDAGEMLHMLQDGTDPSALFEFNGAVNDTTRRLAEPNSPDFCA